ncbi:MAG: cytochrome c3 family protein [Verrucomicrobiota bacterium]
MKLPSTHPDSVPRRALWWLQRKKGLVILLGLLMGSGLISCVSVNRVLVAPPDIPGAEFAGSKTCAECHEDITRKFNSATHARIVPDGPHASELGCESCHGPGSLHNESGGAAHTIINPEKNPETCFRCHVEMRGRFNLPSHHPIEAGKVGCNDCHNPHSGPAIKGGGTSLAGDNETCFKCHSAQRGPHVFEHEALREGCITCHNPHGSINPKLLTERNQNLCLKCHFQQQTAAGLVIGGREHTGSMARGTCWSAGCHEAVHGSQVNSSLRF